jgi:hypothetical protein
MTKSVDVVIVGGNAAAMAAASDAVGRGLRVLVVTRSMRRGLAGRLRRAIRAAGMLAPRQLTVVTGSEVVCVDGVPHVEAVVVRRVRTGRLVAFNASAIRVA